MGRGRRIRRWSAPRRPRPLLGGRKGDTAPSAGGATLPAPEKLDTLISLLTSSKRPLIVSGGGVNRSCAGPEVTALAERLNIPVCTTMTGQGTMPDDHRLAVGVIGDNGFHPHANWALEHADFVLFVGSKMGSVVTIGWTFPKITLNKRVAQIDIDPEIMANNYVTGADLVADFSPVR